MLPFRLKLQTRSVASLLACVFWLVACGGVDSGGTGSFASGPITGFGSVIVGGVRYDVSDAVVLDEYGVPSDSNRLRIGMLSEVRASAPEGAASMPTAKAMQVRFRSEIVGPVDQVDAATGTLTVLGQRVKVGPRTAFDPALTGGLRALHPGDVVEIYGHFDVSANRYVATRIEPGTDAVLYKLRGRVSALNESARTLVVGGLQIDFAALPQAPSLGVGQTVRVLLQTAVQGGTWRAADIEISVNRVPDRPVVEIEGRITTFDSVRQFSIDGFAVVTTDTTQFPDGVTGLVPGAKVEAKGSAQDGVLTATRVSLESDDDEDDEAFELSGSISALDTTAKTFVIRGVTVSYAATQRFEGGLAADLPRARRAEVKGKLSSDGTRLDATSIEMEF